MSKQVTFPTVNSGYRSANQIQVSLDALNQNFQNFLSLDGETPNSMQADLDLNSNDLLNVKEMDITTLKINGQTVTDVSSTPDWKGAWVTSTSYAIDDMVKQNGNVYICLVSHTSGTFVTDLTALKWELMVSAGASGAGSGDLVASSNLSDVSDPATALANLGGEPISASIAKTNEATAWSEDLSVKNDYFRWYHTSSPTRFFLTGFSGGAFTMGITDNTDTNLTGTKDNIMIVEADVSTGCTDISFWKLGGKSALIDDGGATEAAEDESVITREKLTPSLAGRTGWVHVETVYDASTDGLQASVETSTLDDDYEYKVVFRDIRHNDGSTQTFRVEMYLETDATYGDPLVITDTVAASAQMFGTMEFEDLTEYSLFKFARATITSVSGITGGSDTSGSTDSGTYVAVQSLVTSQRSDKLRFSPSGGSFQQGKIDLYKRPIIY